MSEEAALVEFVLDRELWKFEKEPARIKFRENAYP